MKSIYINGGTMEKIKEKYTTENIGKVVDISTYQNYVLVEYSNDSAISQGFDLYNLKTGDRDIMPLNSKARVFQFASSDYIVFESDGVNPLNGHRFFLSIWYVQEQKK